MIRKDYSVQYVRNYLHGLLTLLHLRMDQNVQIFILPMDRFRTDNYVSTVFGGFE